MEFSKAFDPLRAIRASWRMLALARGPMWIGGLLLMFTSSAALSGAGSGNSGDADAWGPAWDQIGHLTLALIAAVAVVFAILWWMLGCLVRVGFAPAAEEVLAKGDTRLGLLFDPRGRFVMMLLTTLLRSVLSAVVAVPLLVAVLLSGLIFEMAWGGGATVALVLCLVYLPLWIYVGLGLSLMPEATAIEGLGPVDALKRSWELAAGRRLTLLLYFIVTQLFGLLGFLACCVGVLLTGPMVEIAYYESYLRYIRSSEDQEQWLVSPS